MARAWPSFNADWRSPKHDVTDTLHIKDRKILANGVNDAFELADHLKRSAGVRITLGYRVLFWNRETSLCAIIRNCMAMRRDGFCARPALEWRLIELLDRRDLSQHDRLHQARNLLAAQLPMMEAPPPAPRLQPPSDEF
jgi:hypothetical protein